MADVILSVGGQIIGGAIGGPIGAAIGGAIGGAIGQTFTPTQKFQGPRLGDLRVTGTEYGQTIPWVAGSPRISGQIIWASPKREIANTQKQGKGGGGGSESTTYTYEVDVAYLLTECPIIGVSRIWSNGELVSNELGQSSSNWFINAVLQATGQIKVGSFQELRVYTGTDDQLPDSLIEASVGIGNTPAYRGRGYVVMKGVQLGTSGQLPNFTFEVGIGGNRIIDLCINPTFERAQSFTGQIVDQTADTFITAAVTNQAFIVDGGTDFFEGTVTFRSYSKTTGSLVSTTTGTSRVLRGGGVLGDYTTKFIQGTTSVAAFRNIVPATVSINSGAEITLPGIIRSQTSFNRAYFVGGLYWFTSTSFPVELFSVDLNGGLVTVYAPSGGEVFETAVLQQDPITSRVLMTYANATDTFVAELDSVSPNPNSKLWSRQVTTGVSGAIGGLFFYFYANRLVLATNRLFDGTSDGNIRLASYRLLDGENFELCGAPVISSGTPRYRTTSYAGDEFVWVDDNSDAEGTGNVYFIGGIIDDTIPGQRISDPLENTISTLMLRAGYTEGQYDVLDLVPAEQNVRGLALSQVSGTRAALELLQGAYFFEAAKTDVVQFFPRQETPVVTIPYADLGFSFDGGDQEQLVLTNSNDLELPAQIAVQYANMLADYQAGTEFSDRILTEQESTNVVQLALGLLPIEAKTIADRMIADLIAGQWRFTIKLPLKYAYLMPGDIFNVIARDGREFRGRIQSKKDSQVLIELECVLDSVGTLDVDAATDANYVEQNTIIDPSVTEWEAMDIPLLRDADNNVSWYGAITPVLVDNTQWPGGVLVQSFSPPAYVQLYTTGDISAIGECDTTLGDWTHGAMFDETNKLTVTLYAGELESVARADMLLDQELNAAAVGVDGQWEIIRFRNAELTGQTSTGLNIYELSGLLRGQRGTEWAIGLHGANERFVLLDTTIRNIPSQLNELNLERFIKGVTSNTPLNDVTERSFTHTGVSLKPFSVAQLRALLDGSDIEVTWNRRTRLSYRYAGINPVVPLGEATEAYRVWIYDGSVMVRTVDVTTETYTYTAANITADGFISMDTIRIEVAQVSAIVGAGYIEEVEVIAP